MSVSLHTTPTYKVEYGTAPVYGWNDISKFIDFLRHKRSEGMDGIWISEDENDIEIDFTTLDELKDDEKYGEVIRDIINDSDKSNGFARLSIF